MQHCRQSQPHEVCGLQSERPAGKAQPAGDLHQLFEVHTLHRDRELPTQCVQVELASVIAQDHRETGQAAFRNLGLTQYRQAHPAREIEQSTVGLSSSSSPCAQQRLEQPLDQRAPLQDDVSDECHVRLQRHEPTVGVHRLSVECHPHL